MVAKRGKKGVGSLEGELSGAKETLFEDVHVVKIPKGRHGPRSMPGDVVELRDGSLLMCYTAHTHVSEKERRINTPDDGIVGRRSWDKGRTWGEEFFLVPNPQPPSKKGYYCHPSVLRLTKGDLLLSYIYATNGEVPHYGHNYYRRSSDEGKTWSEQFIMTPSLGYNIMHNDKLMQLSTGRIIAPVEYQARWGPSIKDHSSYVSRVFYSDDEACSWQRSRNDVDMDPHEAQEPHVAELKDGRLMMIFRTYSGFVGRAYSMDQGETWSKGELVKKLILSPYAGAVTADRIPSTGDLLLIRATGGRDGKRSPLTAAVSQDEGETWIHSRHIADDPDGDYGYQSVTFVDDVAVISYHALDGLHVARIEVDWFYGKG